MQNWNLTWIPNDNESTFIVLLEDEPVFYKTLTGTIFQYVGENAKMLTFVETSKEFSFEQFNEFIMDLEQGNATEFVFDDCDGEETFKYVSETEIFTFNMRYFSCNMKFEMLVTERIRIQFAKVFRQFLFYYLDYLNQEDNWKNRFLYRARVSAQTQVEPETPIVNDNIETPIVNAELTESSESDYEKIN